MFPRKRRRSPSEGREGPREPPTRRPKGVDQIRLALTGLRASYKPRRNESQKSERRKKRLPLHSQTQRGAPTASFVPRRVCSGPPTVPPKGVTEAQRERKARFESPATSSLKGGTNIPRTSLVRLPALYTKGVTILYQKDSYAVKLFLRQR